VRAQARQLCQKSYWAQFDRAPEFVIMFLPGEAFFSAAVEMDPNLYEDCLKSQVIVATPTSLLAVLRCIEYSWRQADLAENAEEIRKHGKDLYDRIALLAIHFEKLGASIESVITIYNGALGSLESRVLVTARRIGELGARSDKELGAPQPIDQRPRELPAGLRQPPVPAGDS
jgi:DNA recombination protein RmuC